MVVWYIYGESFSMKKLVLSGIGAILGAAVVVLISWLISTPAKHELLSDLLRRTLTEKPLGLAVMTYLTLVVIVMMIYLHDHRISPLEYGVIMLSPMAVYLVSTSYQNHYFYEMLFLVAVCTLWRIIYRARFIKAPSNN